MSSIFAGSNGTTLRLKTSLKIKGQILNNPSTVATLCSNGQNLLWCEYLGIGYLPSTGMEYGEEYWENYQAYACSPNAIAINDARVDIVCRNVTPLSDEMCDVGIGNGQFVLTMGCKGYDVNKHAAMWLAERGIYGDPNTQQFKVLTFWDVLEHIDDPDQILNAEHVFVSLPIHQDLDSLLKSKHLKPDEHIWHFTHDGIITFMGHYGYRVVECNDSETKAGREGIWSFYFKKIHG